MRRQQRLRLRPRLHEVDALAAQRVHVQLQEQRVHSVVQRGEGRGRVRRQVRVACHPHTEGVLEVEDSERLPGRHHHSARGVPRAQRLLHAEPGGSLPPRTVDANPARPGRLERAQQRARVKLGAVWGDVDGDALQLADVVRAPGAPGDQVPRVINHGAGSRRARAGHQQEQGKAHRPRYARPSTPPAATSRQVSRRAALSARRALSRLRRTAGG